MTCVKCGNPYGFMLSNPEYSATSNAPGDRREFLTWDCESCGYRVTTPTADAKP